MFFGGGEPTSFARLLPFELDPYFFHSPTVRWSGDGGGEKALEFFTHNKSREKGDFSLSLSGANSILIIM